ncbi:hypothetical protein HYALB_00012897 [Hymenoscyphus albidus]|uniref:Myb/SANT-like domain-containing protein n=1 Tax=Hymenoscyphus albidus TaxID=595503 RepID=A0A9N9LVD1_9HELO|nr:hypothetical protein HYALB_00012897 [Hymenoscyphus albidus]
MADSQESPIVPDHNPVDSLEDSSVATPSQTQTGTRTKPKTATSKAEPSPLAAANDDGKKFSRMTWSAKMQDGLLKECYVQFNLGRTNNTRNGRFTEEAWSCILDKVVDIIPEGDAVKKAISVAHCRNKYGSLVSYWGDFLVLQGTEGMVWNEQKELFEGDDELWDTLAKSNPQIKWHKSMKLVHRDLLEAMIGKDFEPRKSAYTSGRIVKKRKSTKSDERLMENDNESVRMEAEMPARKRGRVSEDDVDTALNKFANVLEGMQRELKEVKEQLKARDEEKEAAENVARDILLGDYQQRLTIDELVAAFETVVCDKVKARALTMIPSGVLRDRFVELALGIQLPQ